MVYKALLIGINYRGTSSELRGCINDINNVKSFLTTVRGIKESNIIIMSDDTTIKPTRFNIIDQITVFAHTANKGDNLHLHYSGHGSSVKDLNGDEDDGFDEALVPLDYLTAGMIADDLLYEILVRSLPAGVNITVVLDCCHSGTAIDLRHNVSVKPIYIGKADYKGKPYIYSDWEATIELYKNTKYRTSEGNIMMLSGCKDNQTSADAYEAKAFQGALTYAFLKALNSSNGYMKWRYLIKDIHCLLKIGGYTQEPKLSSDNFINLDRYY